MKKLSLVITCLMMFNCFNVDAQYRVYKNKYDYRNYIYQPGDPYNPSSAAFASLFVPGLGQMISGESGRGICFLLGCTGCLVFSFAGGSIALNATEKDRDFEKKTLRGITFLFSGLTATAGIWIWSIADAPRVAKVNNLALRDKNKVSGNLSIQPYLNIQSYSANNKTILGLSVNIIF
jgi:TM2 domain-containing membrane protein YozV